MRFASVAEVRDALSEFLAWARKEGEPVIITHHGKPYAILQSLGEEDLDDLAWRELARKKLTDAWEGEEDGLYDYL